MPSHSTHRLHLPRFSFDNSRDLQLLYAIRVLRDLVNKLVYFFIPLFLYNLGPVFFQDLQNVTSWHFNLNAFQQGILAIAVFYGGIRVIIALTAIPLGRLIRNLGHSKSFIVAQILYVFVAWAFYQASTYPLMILVALFFDGIQVNFFWSNLKTMISKNAHKRKMGKDLGVLQFLLQLVAAVSPAIGGLLILMVGYEDVFLIGIILNLLGIILALMMDHQQIKSSPSWKEFKTWLKERTFQKLSATYMGRYFNDILITLWPLYVFLILGSIDRVGYLYSLSLFVAMIMSFFIGSFIDHSKNKRPYFLSGGFLSLISLSRSLAFNAWSIAIVDVFDKLTANFHWLFYDSLQMRRSKGRKAYPFFVYQEVVMGVAAVLIWIVISALFIIWGSWNIIFILGAVGVLLTLLIEDRHSEVK